MTSKHAEPFSNLSLAKNLLICLILWSQKNAALQDLEIWVDTEKLESNQEPRLRTSDTGLGNWSKLLYLTRTYLLGRGVLKDTTYLRTYLMNITYKILLALNLSRHRNIQLARVSITRQTRKVRFESHCNFLPLDRGVAMQ